MYSNLNNDFSLAFTTAKSFSNGSILLFQIMALRILREVALNIKNAVLYSIMADESADISNKEQLVICLRWIDENCIAHEEFIGMHPLTGTDADQIVAVIKVNSKVRLNFIKSVIKCIVGILTYFTNFGIF